MAMMVHDAIYDKQMAGFVGYSLAAVFAVAIIGNLVYIIKGSNHCPKCKYPHTDLVESPAGQLLTRDRK
jgi:hypothetical protein